MLHLRLLLALTASLTPVLPAAEELPPRAVNVDGTWRWTFTMSDGTKVEPRAKLKQQGDAITGLSIIRPGQEAPITDGKISGDSVRWSVVREHNGRKVVTRYQGTLDGDTIKGSIETDWAGPGELRRYDWEAHRRPITPEGAWRWVSGSARPGAGAGGRGQRGQRGAGVRQARATFKLTGEKVTGKINVAGREIEIKHGRFIGGELSFDVVRERETQRSVTHYRGKVADETIKGDIQAEPVGDTRPRSWQATRVEE